LRFGEVNYHATIGGLFVMTISMRVIWDSATTCVILTPNQF